MFTKSQNRTEKNDRILQEKKQLVFQFARNKITVAKQSNTNRRK